jgi:hemerythrin-like metal-binding protein
MNSDMFEWKPEYSVKIDSIDAQHKILFGLASELRNAMAKGQGKAALESILDRLVAYTVAHFANEEVLMAKYKYPRLAEHKVEHEALTKKVKQLREELKTGQSVLTVDVMQFLQNWLSKHIQHSDMRYAEFINARAAA